ncbi:MAG: AMP-binding protein [Betaproteobacteria bacterium]|nr:AMP-binding protein [Betaproteobacteria bacterium]
MGQNLAAHSIPALLADRGHAGRAIVYNSAASHDEIRFERLLRCAATLSRDLSRAGVDEGRPIASVLPTSFDALVIILAAWMHRSPVCLLPWQMRGHVRHAALLRDTLGCVAPGVTFVPKGQRHPGEGRCAATPLCHAIEPGQLLSDDGSPIRWNSVPDDLAILQLSSGTTGRPRLIPITHAHLVANATAIAERAGTGPDTPIVSWMPLHHDMGLGVFTQALFGGGDLIMLPTEVFSATPWSWLTAIQTHRGAPSTATPSSLRLLGLLASRGARPRVDLSSLGYVWVGAEPVFPHALIRFEEGLRADRLGEWVLQPAYGLAEASSRRRLAGAGRHAWNWGSIRNSCWPDESCHVTGPGLAGCSGTVLRWIACT